MNDLRLAPSAAVDLWRVGEASLLHQTVTRAVWIAIAQLVGLGVAPASAAAYIEMSADIVVGLALLAVVSVIFMLLQTRLILQASARSLRLGNSTTALASRLVAGLLLGMAAYLAYDQTVPSLIELSQTAQGDNELREGTMEVSDDGTQLMFAQTFSEGTAVEFKQTLLLAPKLETVRLRSPGGRIKEAVGVFRAIKLRGLDTVVDEFCFSACTIAYLGGRQRVLHEEATLGFHAISFPGLTQSDLRDPNRAMMEFLVQEGVQASFAKRAVNTPPEALWLPSNAELLESGVVHRIIPTSGGTNNR